MATQSVITPKNNITGFYSWRKKQTQPEERLFAARNKKHSRNAANHDLTGTGRRCWN